LFRKTDTPTEALDEAPAPPDDGEAEGRGDAAAEAHASNGRPAPAPARPRRKRTPASGKTKGCKIHLPEELHDRLWLLARHKRSTVSAVATEILDKNTPRFRLEREAV
jgi:hypothetical protein